MWCCCMISEIDALIELYSTLFQLKIFLGKFSCSVLEKPPKKFFKVLSRKFMKNFFNSETRGNKKVWFLKILRKKIFHKNSLNLLLFFFFSFHQKNMRKILIP